MVNFMLREEKIFLSFPTGYFMTIRFPLDCVFSVGQSTFHKTEVLKPSLSHLLE